MAHQKCLHCGEPIPKGKREDAVYCSEKCRKQAGKERREKGGNKRKANAGSLSGISVSPVAQPTEKNVAVKQTEKQISKPVAIPQPEKEIPLTFEMMPTLRGYIENPDKGNSDIPPPPEPPEPFNEERPMEIKKQFENYSVAFPNPEYKKLSEKKQRVLGAIGEQKIFINAEEKKLEDIRQSTNITALHYIIAGASGGLIGNQVADENKDGGTFFGMVLGIVGMKIYQWATEKYFQQQKAEAVKIQTENIRLAKAVLDKYSNGLGSFNEMLAKESEMLSERKSRLANADAIAKRESEIREYEKRKNEAHLSSKKYSDEIAEYEKKYGNILSEDKTQKQEMPKAQVDSSGVVPSTGLGRVVGGNFALQGKWLAFLGKPSRDFQMLIHGESGSGKSHLGLNIAYYLAVHHGTVLYNTSEEGFSVTMDQKVNKLGAKVKGLDIGNFETFEDFKKNIPTTAYNFIIIDSVNDMHMDNKLFSQFTKHYSCSAVIGICQNTKAGEMRGSSNLAFDTDIRIRVENGIAHTDKNRFINDKPDLDVFNIGAVPPVRKIPNEKKEDKKEIPQTRGKIIPLNGEQEKPKPLQEENNNDDENKNGDWDNGGFDIDGLDHIM